MLLVSAVGITRINWNKIERELDRSIAETVDINDRSSFDRKNNEAPNKSQSNFRSRKRKARTRK